MMRSRLLEHGGAVRLAIAVGVVFVGAVFLGWGAGEAPVPAIPATPPAAWSLPAGSPEDPAHSMALLTARKPWSATFGGNTAAAAAPPAAASQWRLAGIVARGNERFALIATGVGPAAKLDYLQVGDRLPDGSQLVAIATDSVAAEAPKSPAQRRVYRLFGETR